MPTKMFTKAKGAAHHRPARWETMMSDIRFVNMIQSETARQQAIERKQAALEDCRRIVMNRMMGRADDYLTAAG